MSDSIKDEFEKILLVKDIAEREDIIRRYEDTGFLDRDDAIKKIQELRIADNDVAKVTFANLTASSVPFSQSTDGQIISELYMQRSILKEKLAKRLLEDK